MFILKSLADITYFEQSFNLNFYNNNTWKWSHDNFEMLYHIAKFCFVIFKNYH